MVDDFFWWIYAKLIAYAFSLCKSRGKLFIRSNARLEISDKLFDRLVKRLGQSVFSSNPPTARNPLHHCRYVNREVRSLLRSNGVSSPELREDDIGGPFEPLRKLGLDIWIVEFWFLCNVPYRQTPTEMGFLVVSPIKPGSAEIANAGPPVVHRDAPYNILSRLVPIRA